MRVLGPAWSCCFGWLMAISHFPPQISKVSKFLLAQAFFLTAKTADCFDRFIYRGLHIGAATSRSWGGGTLCRVFNMLSLSPSGSLGNSLVPAILLYLPATVHRQMGMTPPTCSQKGQNSVIYAASESDPTMVFCEGVEACPSPCSRL